MKTNKPAICVGHWDNKTGAFHKHLTEIQQKRVDEGFLQPVYTAGMLPIRELTDEEILKLEEIEFDNYCVDKESKGRKTATITDPEWAIWFAKAILRKAQEK